jgi:hypothetical protein
MKYEAICECRVLSRTGLLPRGRADGGAVVWVVRDQMVDMNLPKGSTYAQVVRRMKEKGAWSSRRPHLAPGSRIGSRQDHH